ncbi:hypothetical protein BLNAU_11142 [Blattamonas nauphoetae]|uniref:Uncharacterized protein n=1 Tax=Blattamonas nauphoetae TaxID=2049346 RepID=A0ABQ9XQZ3_9EUKA|nr:hypothetical protein BLNAU_11142 [Blattamonas nauphoetae]
MSFRGCELGISAAAHTVAFVLPTNTTTSSIIDPDTLELMVTSENVTKTFHNIHNTPYTVPFTKQYRYRLENTNVYYHSFGHRHTDFSPLFKPEKVIIKEKNLAKVVYCGGHPVKRPHPMSQILVDFGTGTELYVPISSTLPNKNKIPCEYLQMPPDTTMPFYIPDMFTADDFQKVSSAAELEFIKMCIRPSSGDLEIPRRPLLSKTTPPIWPILTLSCKR